MRITLRLEVEQLPNARGHQVYTRTDCDFNNEQIRDETRVFATKREAMLYSAQMLARWAAALRGDQ